MPPYPQNMEEALGQPLKFPPATLRAVRAFAASKPWRGTFEERQAKFRQLHADYCRIYGINPTLNIEGDGTGDSGGSGYCPISHTITLVGKLSVITFMHEWGHILRGHSEFEACRWSLRLFERCFPKSFARLQWEGHVARKADGGQEPNP
jgi:hypothetical protein